MRAACRISHSDHGSDDLRVTFCQMLIGSVAWIERIAAIRVERQAVNWM